MVTSPEGERAPIPEDSLILNHASTLAGSPADIFPCGLVQPAGSFRFGLDALLLAALAVETAKGLPTNKNFSAAELGCGCGAALLGLGLALPNCHGLGLERELVLVEAARQNATLLGLEQRIGFACQDLGQWQGFIQALGRGGGQSPEKFLETQGQDDLQEQPDCPNLPQELPVSKLASNLNLGKFDLVLANPPYGADNSGRPSPSPRRESALRDSAAPAIFCQAACQLLRHHGHFVCIFAPSGLSRLLLELAKARLGLRKLLPVAAKASQPALRILVHARKNAAEDCQILPPLVLHDPDGSWSKDAVAFCPWLS